MSANKSSSKRKRQEGGSERPAKKNALAPPTGNVRVEYLENNDVLGPLLAATPGLKFPPKITFKPYKRSKVLPTGEVSEVLLQSSEHARLDYTAREEKDGSADSQLQDYIGVFDPTTSKLQLMPVRRVTVRTTLRSETEELQNRQAQIEAVRSTNRTKRNELAQQFGSKKSRKAIEDITLNAISRGDAGKDNGMAENVLQGMASSTSDMPTSKDLAAAVDSSKPRPRANVAAEYPEDVYTTDVIVGRELMEAIPVKDWVDASRAGEGVSVSSRFVAKRILSLVKNKQIQKLKVLRFILLCIQFNDSLFAGGKGAKKVPNKEKLQSALGEDIPESVVNGIRRRFASETNDMPRWNTDNLITHICAAALIVDGFEVDVNDIRNDLKLENKDIKQYFTELGCRISAPNEGDLAKLKITKAESKSHFMAKLKLPLVFPTVKKGPSKRR